MLNELLIAASSYVTPMLCNYFCDEEHSSDDLNRIDMLHQLCSKSQNALSQLVGERNWSLFCDIIVDNAWISVIVIEYLRAKRKNPIDNETTISIIEVFIGNSVLCWSLKKTLERRYPNFIQYLSPRKILK